MGIRRDLPLPRNFNHQFAAPSPPRIGYVGGRFDLRWYMILFWLRWSLQRSRSNFDEAKRFVALGDGTGSDGVKPRGFA
ncbi:unnamed protein product [Caenorhabditis auriculariae]|uniref:Uncharacterized protein n=1 Tax=Caenorhabditis auriculariae TaxID=2777116 RepID=A0A8S1HIL0_9PELO|nr:unnamed protein product [Caenorhabditis auriculariae]